MPRTHTACTRTHHMPVCTHTTSTHKYTHTPRDAHTPTPLAHSQRCHIYTHTITCTDTQHHLLVCRDATCTHIHTHKCHMTNTYHIHTHTLRLTASSTSSFVPLPVLTTSESMISRKPTLSDWMKGQREGGIGCIEPIVHTLTPSINGISLQNSFPIYLTIIIMFSCTIVHGHLKDTDTVYVH